MKKMITKMAALFFVISMGAGCSIITDSDISDLNFDAEGTACSDYCGTIRGELNDSEIVTKGNEISLSGFYYGDDAMAK